MNRTPFWDDESMAAGRPPSSAANAPSEMESYFSEFFGPLNPLCGAHLLPHSAAGAGALGNRAERSGDGEMGSSSGTKSGPPAAAEARCCPSDEVEGRSEPLRKRKRKRNRTSALHNLAEKRRRDRIKEKLKILQELVPNSHKLDRASMLDEAIGYIRSLQQQVQIMSSAGNLCPAQFVPPPPALSQISLFPTPGLNLGMNIGFGVGVPSVSSSTGNPMVSPSASLPAASLVPMAAVNSMQHFQSQLAMHYWPFNAPQEPPASTATCSQALPT